MADFIHISVEGTETLLNLANVVSIQFWEEGEYRSPVAAIVTTGFGAARHPDDPDAAHTIIVGGDEPVSALRAELERAGILSSEASSFHQPYATHEGEREYADYETAELDPDHAVIDPSMPVRGPKFDRGRPQRGYNHPK
jgi:hypothetical protein